MSDEATIEAIQQRMREVRRELSQDLASSARDITDWRSYVRASPWLALGAAAAVGYFLVPKGPPVVRLQGLDVKKFVHEGEANAMASIPQRKPSVAGKLISSLAGLALRGAMAYVTHRLTQAKVEEREAAPY
jgi:hypothetical protein